MPVDPATLGAFILATAALVMSPGPDTVLILRYTLSAGQRVGLATVAGVQLGLAVHTAAAALGLSVVIASSPALFGLVAVAGAAYLAWLGAQALRSGGGLALGREGAAAVGAGKACRDAMLTNILNPKVILLFLALMPNFVALERGAVGMQLATLGIALIAVNVVWQAAIALAAEAFRRWLARPGVVRTINAATGLVLIGFSVMMIAEHVW